MVEFCQLQAHLGEQQGKMLPVGSPVTSNSFLSFKARELKFCIHTSNINTKKITMVIFKNLIWGL